MRLLVGWVIWNNKPLTIDHWSTDITYWPPNFKIGVAVLFARLALNVMQTVLLQLKIIPCDSAYAWHTSSILCNQRTLGQNTQDRKQSSSTHHIEFFCQANKYNNYWFVLFQAFFWSFQSVKIISTVERWNWKLHWLSGRIKSARAWSLGRITRARTLSTTKRRAIPL